ncbi:MarR family winged helix-turn-helix transcriptional regulator [Allorhizobium taibaishanense]|uniref:MarR family transcriptional regulator n=1 Tax=Allorhizobium taibaishanense TaxID=887144 RepID=A0A1Q9AAU5_9HYPH|nr:MarR family transcriptional regulator [Allorhizobium taibaishanense]MBB4007157.1 DNA-binding MarR family transcriptional regulator [Allorhizobium taibaishanense]OLP51985.1 MarR family transcriptional regulator [Allorhizobium taibaishanense]
MKTDKTALNDSVPADDAAPSAMDEALDGISGTMARMRMMMGRRFMSRIALSRMESGQSMELSHFDVIKIVSHAGRDQEVTVGVIAEQMRIDPSRASRVVADLVRRGALRREASQADARRTIVALTENGRHVLRHFETVRREVISQTLANWNPEDIILFETLFDRFISGLECRGRDVGLADKDAADGEN